MFDSEVRKQVQEVGIMVDSLVINNHPDPKLYIDQLDTKEAGQELRDLFRKYVAGQHYFFEHRKDFDISMQYADSSLYLFENEEIITQNQMYYLYAILLKENVLRKKQLYGTSIQYLLHGWQMIDPVVTPCVASEYLGKLGTISYLQEKYLVSKDYYSRAWKATEICEEEKNFAYYKNKYQYFQNIAANYSQLEKPDSALYYINLSLDIIDVEMNNKARSEPERHFMELARGVALGNKASESVKLKDEIQAEVFWKKSIEINLKPGFATEHAQFMRLHLADYYIDSNRTNEAKALLDKVKIWLQSNSSKTGERRWLNVYWHWLEKMGLHEQALDTYKQYVDQKEKLEGVRKELAALDLTNQLQLMENQYYLDHLESEGRLQRVYFFTAIIITVMALIILFLVWRNWIESQENVSRLSVLNDTISRKNEQLEKTNKAVSKIMSIVSHDLRSPLAGVREISAVMEYDENLGEEQRKWAKMIKNTTSQSLRLMNEILNFDLQHFSENGHHSVPERMKPVKFDLFLKECIDVHQLKAQEKNQIIHLHSPSDMTVWANSDQITRVINNVIDNAIKFSPEHTSIFVKANKKSGKILISITDEGLGIPAHKKNEIFKMNSNARRSGTNNEKSYGLGLSISKEIVEAHNGRIWFESSELTGTTFFIELPSNPQKIT